MEVVNSKRSMTLPDGSWHECEDKRCAEKQGLHGVLRKIKSANNFRKSVQIEGEIEINKNKIWSRSVICAKIFWEEFNYSWRVCTYYIYMLYIRTMEGAAVLVSTAKGDGVVVEGQEVSTD